MEAVRIIQGTAVPLDRSDVDTDQIIPAEWLKRVERTGFGAGLFASWRDDRSFILNDERHAGANVLVAGANFGVGSSREHAVWALQDYGFDAIIAPSFGDIFRTNAGKIGMLAIALPADEVERLMESVDLDSGSEMRVDLERRVIVAPDGREVAFDFDETTRDRILHGLDEIALTLQHEDAIAAYETAHGLA